MKREKACARSPVSCSPHTVLSVSGPMTTAGHGRVLQRARAAWLQSSENQGRPVCAGPEAAG